MVITKMAWFLSLLCLAQSVSQMRALTTEVVNETVIQGQVHQSCNNAIKALFIVDPYEFGHSFTQLRRVYMKFVDGLPDESLVYLVTVGNIFPVRFKKIAGDESWKAKFGGSSNSHDEIKHTSISEAIYKLFDTSEIPKMSEQIFLLVNEKTEIDDIEKAEEAMRLKKRYIVLYGNTTEGDVWTKLSMDKFHIQELGTIDDEALSEDIQSVKKQSCFDSKYVCNTDQFWDEDKKICYTCSYICSDSKSTSSSSCNCKCPYFFKSADTNDIQGNNQSMTGHTTINCYDEERKADDGDDDTVENVVISILVILVIFILCVILYCCYTKKLYQALTCWKRKEQEEEKDVEQSQPLHSPISKAQEPKVQEKEEKDQTIKDTEENKSHSGLQCTGTPEQPNNFIRLDDKRRPHNTNNQEPELPPPEMRHNT